MEVVVATAVRVGLDGGSGSVAPAAACAARRAWPIGSGMPSGSSRQVPCPAQPAAPSASAAWPFGHSPELSRIARAASGVSPGAAAAMSAAIPATCGVAMLVPDDVFHPPPAQLE